MDTLASPPPGKCAHCSVAIRDGDLLVYRRGDFLHVRCWQVLQREHIDDSRRIAEKARDSLARSLKHLEQSKKAVADSLCIACGLVIVPTERVNTPKGPAHRECGRA